MMVLNMLKICCLAITLHTSFRLDSIWTGTCWCCFEASCKRLSSKTWEVTNEWEI